MISPIKNYTGELTDKQIDEASERYGYESFIPYGFIRDLFNVWTHVMFGEPPERAISIDNDYEKAFSKLISFIHIDRIQQTLGTEFVFNVLKKYGPKLNLRGVEESRSLGKPFDFQLDKQYNYNFNLKDVSYDVLRMLGISLDKPVNEIELTEEIRDILKYYSGLVSFLGFVKEFPELKRERMKYYYQIYKVPKRRLVYPSFAYDFATKSLPVKIPIVERKDRDTLILLIDVSYSAHQNPAYRRLYNGILLYFIDNFKNNVNTLKIYYFAFNIVSYVEVTSKEELIELYQKPLPTEYGYKGWAGSIRSFKKLLSSETVVLVTDGNKDATALDFTSNNSYHIISLKDNDVLKSLASVTNGKFIKV